MHATPYRFAFLILMLMSVVAVPAVRAQSPNAGSPVAVTRVTEGTLWWRTGAHAAPAPAPLLATDVAIQVTGVVARATVRQQFAKPSQEWAEGLYVFPLPEDAAVDHLRMKVGERVIEGVVKEREAAKKTYEAAKHQGQHASLVEQERPNVFTTSIANIAPGAAISIEIEYQHVLRFDQGRLTLRFPMVVGPRYIPGTPTEGGAFGGSGWASNTDQVPDASRITPPVRHPALGPINPVTIQVDLAPGVPLARLESSYHRITSTALGADRYRVTLGDGVVPANRDFELVWEPAAGAMPASAVFTETTKHGVFGLVMLLPPAATTPNRPRVPREAIFVIDTSGSMAGASIEQAKAALKLALGRLQPGDTFNVIQFNSWTDSVFPAAEPVSPPNLYLANRYVDRLKAQGGTEMLKPLTRALEGRGRPGALRQVVFLTDGQVGNEEELFEVIRQRLGETRLFTVGIGSTPNSHFMRETARLGRGTFTYIGSPTEVQEKMEALFRKIESPVLTDVHVEFPGAVPTEALPARVPDLYVGEPIVITLRADAPPTRAVLRGRLGETPWSQEVWLQDADAHAGLSVHWARTKIATLLDQRRSGITDDEVRAAVLEVALDHHLVSPYTSLVAVDVTPVRRPDEALHSHALETNVPHGWDDTAVLGLGQGATDGPLHAVLGLAALLMAAALFALMRFRKLTLAVVRQH